MEVSSVCDGSVDSPVDAILSLDTVKLSDTLQDIPDEALTQIVAKLRKSYQVAEEIRKLREDSKQAQLGKVDQVAITVDHDSRHRIPPEVLRQVMRSGYLSTREIARLFLFTCKSFAAVLGHEYVYRHLCFSRWQNMAAIPRSIIEARGFQWLYRRRLAGVLLQDKDGDLTQLPPPALSSTSITFLISVWNGEKEIVSLPVNSSHQIHDFLTQASMTLELQTPIAVASLPAERCHCWNLPRVDVYVNWRATVHFLRLDTNQCYCLLDTPFKLWRGWNEIGELTFVQRERIRGLELTDRGKFIEHRIVQTSSIRDSWYGYIGLQFKLILICSAGPKRPSAKEILFEYQQLRLEAIRLHENSYGNIQHNLFRKDAGWQKHGVELLHLLEELVCDKDC